MDLALYMSFVSGKPQLWQTALLAYSRVCTHITLIFGASTCLAKNLFFPASFAAGHMSKFSSMRSKRKAMGGAAGEAFGGVDSTGILLLASIFLPETEV